MKRSADVALVPAGVKRPRTELVAAAQSQQLTAMVLRVFNVSSLFYANKLLYDWGYLVEELPL